LCCYDTSNYLCANGNCVGAKSDCQNEKGEIELMVINSPPCYGYVQPPLCCDDTSDYLCSNGNCVSDSKDCNDEN